mgnify:CR=1 FL=1
MTGWNGPFLHDMMVKLGFHEQWIEMIMACVGSVRYKIRFNSQETDVFTPTRGIRQGVHSPPTFCSFVQKVFLVYCSLKKKLVA